MFQLQHNTDYFQRSRVFFCNYNNKTKFVVPNDELQAKNEEIRKRPDFDMK